MKKYITSRNISGQSVLSIDMNKPDDNLKKHFCQSVLSIDMNKPDISDQNKVIYNKIRHFQKSFSHIRGFPMLPRDFRYSADNGGLTASSP